MRPIALACLLLCSGALLGEPVSRDWAATPLTLVAEKVDLTVGRELTLVSGRFMFQYVEQDDAGHVARLLIHFPLYVDQSLTGWQDIATASDIKLQIGDRTFLPISGSLVDADSLSAFPIPEDVSVAFMTFEIPREAATLRFETTISYVQPNFHYRGALLAAYTPWQPKILQVQKAYDFADKDFEVELRGLKGIVFRKFTANKSVLKDSGSELAVVPAHRETIAVQIRPAESAKPATGPRGADAKLPAGFVLGADISALAAPARYRRAPLPAYQDRGASSDELTILHHHGWTAFRLRVFVSPVRDAPDNSLANTIPLARRIKAAGATFLLCIHLSDTWADPQHQEIPVAWRNLDFGGLEKRVESYTHDVVKELKDAGAMPDWVQVGNEITRGTLWPLAQVKEPGSTQYNPPEPYDDTLQWDHLTRVLKAGIRGVLSAAGDTPPRIAIHIDKGGDWSTTRWFFDHLDAAHVKYDIIAQSFYPPWHHGTLEQLWENMHQCARRYNRDFLVVETGYLPTRVKDNDDMLWPVTPEGRQQYLADLISTVAKAPRGLGVMYWAPEWDLWNADGSPGPAVDVLEHLTTLIHHPESHAPPAVNAGSSDYRPESQGTMSLGNAARSPAPVTGAGSGHG